MKKDESPPENTNEEVKVTPLMTESSASTSSASSRRNLSSTIHRTDRYKNIDDGMIPFKRSSSAYGKKNNMLEVKDTVILCQKAFTGFCFCWTLLFSF